MPAGPAVVGVVADIRLATISGETVTIAKARVADRDDTVSIRTGADSVRQIADMPAEPAVVGIGLQVHTGPAATALTHWTTHTRPTIGATRTIAGSRLTGATAITAASGAGDRVTDTRFSARADMTASATVVGIGLQIRLTTIVQVAIAVAKSCIAANAACAS